MRFKIKEGINYDYILAIRLKGNKFENVKIAIKRNLNLIRSLVEMSDATDSKIYHMDNLIRRTIDINKNFDCCLNNKYHHGYISDIHYPTVDYSEDDKKWQKFKDDRFRRAINTLRPKHKEWSERELEWAAGEHIIPFMNKKNTEDKKKFLENCVKYIYAYDYNIALDAIIAHKDFFAFSTEEHGRFKFTYPVNKDINLSIHTNFGYGSASCFQVTVTYKGIKLCPYSIGMKYYYADFEHLMQCTRSYYCKREYWVNLMCFVTDFVNNAIADPDKFIRKYVIFEIDSMIEGLGQIYRMDDVAMEKMMNTKHSVSDKYRGISFVHHPREAEKSHYKAYPKETLLLYKTEKIAGALHFLESLGQFQKIYNEVDLAISRIIELNTNLYPLITEGITQISTNIKNLKTEIEKEKRILTRLSNYVEFKQKILNKRLENASNQEEVIHVFLIKYPDYKNLLRQKKEQEEKVEALDINIFAREQFIEKLTDNKILIEKMSCINPLAEARNSGQNNVFKIIEQ